MSTNAAVLTAAVLLLTTGFQQSKGGSAQSGWVVFSPEGGGFSVMLPGKPTERAPRQDTKTGRTPAPLYEITSGDFKYAVTYMDYPFSVRGAQRDKLLDMGAEAGISGAGVKIVSNKPISLGEHPGREVKGEKQGFVSHSRVYLVNQRLYLLIVWRPSDSADSESAAKFLDSFKLVAP